VCGGGPSALRGVGVAVQKPRGDGGGVALERAPQRVRQKGGIRAGAQLAQQLQAGALLGVGSAGRRRASCQGCRALVQGSASAGGRTHRQRRRGRRRSASRRGSRCDSGGWRRRCSLRFFQAQRFVQKRHHARLLLAGAQRAKRRHKARHNVRLRRAGHA
jgi:hypothetical protein